MKKNYKSFFPCEADRLDNFLNNTANCFFVNRCDDFDNRILEICTNVIIQSPLSFDDIYDCFKWFARIVILARSFYTQSNKKVSDNEIRLFFNSMSDMAICGRI